MFYIPWQQSTRFVFIALDVEGFVVPSDLLGLGSSLRLCPRHS